MGSNRDRGQIKLFAFRKLNIINIINRVSCQVFYEISDSYILHCGGKWWVESIEKKGMMIADILPYTQPEVNAYRLHIS
jgi:hypothetical protein